MEQQGKKKEWVAPELLVLVRSHPEETVLAACKGNGIGADPTNFFLTCNLDDGGSCTSCSGNTLS